MPARFLLGQRDKVSRISVDLNGFFSEKVVALDADESDDDVNAALKIMTRTTGKYLAPLIFPNVFFRYTVKSDFLPKSVIQTTLLPEITVGHHDGKQISALHFHKTKNVLITADHGGNVKLFEVRKLTKNVLVVTGRQ